MGVRVAARGSGAGSLVNYLLGISGVDPIRHGLLMERFLSPLRAALPDVDVDVESARRTEVYEKILDRFGGERVACVSMMDTYRVRHAIRDVGAALGMPPGEIDQIAKAFPHIRARDVHDALRELPELRASRLAGSQLDLLFRLVARLDGLPRHVALHPCGVLLSDTTLLDRTPVEASWLGFPMSQFDKDDVEELGLLKLDVLGIRMQSAMAHAIQEVRRVDGAPDDPLIDLDDQTQVPLDDPETFALIQSTRTLGMFQIESPGQRELVGKFAPETFGDLITDISLFRPGPVKSDMVTPFLRARQGWAEAEYLHDEPALRAGGDLRRRGLPRAGPADRVDVHRLHAGRGRRGAPCAGHPRRPARGRGVAASAGLRPRLRRAHRRPGLGGPQGVRVVRVLQGPRGRVRTADLPVRLAQGPPPGGLPRRGAHPRPRHVPQAADPRRRPPVRHRGAAAGREPLRRRLPGRARRPPCDDLETTGRGEAGAASHDHQVVGWRRAADYGIRLSLAEVKGISEAEVARIVAGRPYGSLADFWHRAGVSRPVVERLVLTGAFDDLYVLGSVVTGPSGRPGRLTRRDLLLQVGELDRWSRSVARGHRAGSRSRRTAVGAPARGRAPGRPSSPWPLPAASR